jgi:hypothetical protein
MKATTHLWFGILATLAILNLSPASRAATVDGAVSLGEYGAPLAIQDTPTGYGDTDGVMFFGSELDAIYGNLIPGGIELALTGNIEDGTGNSIVIFLDVRAGGAVDTILGGGYGQLGSFGGQRTDDWGNDVDGGPGVTNTAGGSSILDPGFDPDISIEINAGDGFGNYHINIIDMTLLNDDINITDVDQFLGSNLLGGGAVTQTYTRDDGDTAKGSGGMITHALDNSNTGGVTTSDASDPTSASTGLEMLLSSDFLQVDPGHKIRILAFITNPSGEFLSNQFLPGLGGVANLDNPGGLGGVPLFDAREFAGDQFVCLVPEPTAVVLCLMSGIALRRVRSRRLKN